MNFLEKDLEDIIYDASQTPNGNQKLREKGLNLNYCKMFRQVDLGTYGKADLVTCSISYSKRSRDIDINVIELKKDLIDVNALLQACRYVTGINRILENHFKKSKQYNNFNFEVTLIGRSMSMSDDFAFLYNMIDDWCKVYEYKYDIDGIKFNYLEGYYVKRKEILTIPNNNINKKDLRKMYINSYE